MISFNPRVANAAARRGEAENRKELFCVLIANGEAVACNGYLVARTPVKGVSAATLIPAQAIRDAGESESIEVEKRGTDLVIKGQRKILTELVAAPIGALANIGGLDPTTERLAYVAIDVKQLRLLLACCPQDGGVVKLRVRGPFDAVEFVAGEISGMMMPYCVPEEDDRWRKQKLAP